MIRYLQGDILDADVEALVNTVNCVGVMGKGIALQFKEAYPDNFRTYKAACDRGDVQPGRMLVFETDRIAPRYIINFPTKRHWRGRSRLEDISSGLDALAREITERRIRSIAIPPLGSGLGGLPWERVRALVDRAMSPLEGVDITVYEPTPGVATHRRRDPRGTRRVTAGRAALVRLIHRYLAGLMDPVVTNLEIHKLMYFLQEAGEPLRLRYVKATYGPYAENLRHVLRDVDGFLVDGFRDDGDLPTTPLTLMPGAVERADSYLTSHVTTDDRINRVAELVEGFETPASLELLATVHWLVSHDGITDRDQIVAETYSWAPRKQQFTPDQIELATERLVDEGWIQLDTTAQLASP